MRHLAFAAGLALALAAGAAQAQPARGAAPAGPDIAAPAVFATLDLRTGFLPDPREVPVVSGGGLDARVLGGNCVGWIATRATVTLTYTAGASPLIFRVESGADTTLAVLTPDGTWLCNDDFDGLNPAVVIRRPASGEYRIWVGSFGRGQGQPARLHITELRREIEDAMARLGRPVVPGAGPDIVAPARFGTFALQAGLPPDPHEVQVRVLAGGAFDASALGGGCLGYIDATGASVALTYTAGALPLIFQAESDADTTLAVRLPDGAWLCNDDFDGLNPGVVIPRPASGEYRIWVGTFSPGPQQAPAWLQITEIMPGRPGQPAAAGAGPNVQAPARYATVALAAGFLPDPHEIRVEAGGELDAGAARLGPGCIGWIDATRADVTLTYTAGNFPLFFSAESRADTTLVILGPDGRWLCNDDFQGLNPGIITQRPASGEYRIWVGTFNRGRPEPALLRISEVLPRR